MKIQFKKGLYVANSRNNYKLNEDTEQIEDAFCFENASEISKERYKRYMKEVNRGKSPNRL